MNTLIGRIGKTFGISGDLKIHIQEQYIPFLLESEFLFIKIRGDKVPFYILEIYESGSLLISLEDIDSPSKGIELVGCECFIELEHPVEVTSSLEFSHISSFTLFDGEVLVGQIINIEQYPQQEMAYVKKEEEIVLIPLHVDLIEKIDIKNQKVIMNLPQGLI